MRLILVNHLREVANTLSFVAIKSEQVVGHIFFSPVKINGDYPEKSIIMGLAPLAMLPQYQRQTIASSLIKHGLREYAHLGYKAGYTD